MLRALTPPFGACWQTAFPSRVGKNVVRKDHDADTAADARTQNLYLVDQLAQWLAGWRQSMAQSVAHPGWVRREFTCPAWQLFPAEFE